ncbi:MAG: aa3-type cytochrome c oxidase subunit IV [Cereibacter sphaeroides]|uniref:Aa3-type cytochrome c oxidase subunit IV n=1 Tax=Cereibacter sphaeroides TaxID=1063 RepID=A0A2W5S7L3_CERSP|nr:MAG: aa3-type cytochrome c oxidase subunit IV [Cereibacter sphaeroides]
MAGTDHTTEHKHGTMRISTQEKTFEGFVRMVAWGAGISIAVLIFLALANS